MVKKEQTSFIDDAFDDKKAQEEMEKIKGSNRLGCIFVVLIAIIVLVGLLLAFVGILGS